MPGATCHTLCPLVLIGDNARTWSTLPCRPSLPTMNLIKKNVLYLTALQGLNYVLPLVTVVYLVRIFGPAGYGKLALAQAFVQAFGVLVDFGFALSATRMVAQNQDNPSQVRSVFRSVIVAKSLLAAAAFPVMFAIAWAVPSLRSNLLLCCAYYLSILGGVFIPGWLYQGFQRMGVFTLITALPRILSTLAILSFVRHDDQLLLAALLLSAAPLLCAVAALTHCRKWLGLSVGFVRLREVRAQFQAGWHVFLATAAGAIYLLSPIFVLGLLAPPTQVGYFAAAERLIKAALNLFNPISQALYPHLARLFIESRRGALRLLGQILLLVLACYGLLAVVCQILPGDILNLAFGPRFVQADIVLRVLAFYALLSTVNNISGALYLVPLNQGSTLSSSVVVPTALHLVLIYPVALAFGSAGIAALLVATELAILTMRVSVTFRRDPGDLRQIARGCLHPMSQST